MNHSKYKNVYDGVPTETQLEEEGKGRWLYKVIVTHRDTKFQKYYGGLGASKKTEIGYLAETFGTREEAQKIADKYMHGRVEATKQGY